MSTNLTAVERRWRTLAMNRSLPVKMRLTALEHMKAPSDRWLCSFLKKLTGKGRSNSRLAFEANLMLDRVRQEAFKRKLLAEHGPPYFPEATTPKASILDI